MDAVASRLLVNLAGQAPLLAGADQVAYVDIDDTIRATYGYAKQGTGYGYTGVKGLNVPVATVSTPTAAPVIAGTRLRKGNAASAHGAPRMIADAVGTAKKAGATAPVTVRADSAYYNQDVIAATTKAAAYCSVTARMDRAVSAADHPHPRTGMGWGSSTRKRTGNRSSNGGSPRPKSPRWSTRRSRPGGRISTCRPAHRAPSDPTERQVRAGRASPGWDKGHVEGVLKFRDMVGTAAEYVPQLKAAGADVVVVLSHAGLGDSSYSVPGLPEENPADDIDREVLGIDVMVIGHTHRDAPEQVITNEVTGEPVLLTQAYRWGGTVARVDLDLQKVRGQWDVEGAEGMAIRTQDYPEHPAVVEALQPAHDKTVEYVNQVVAAATEELSGAESFPKDTAIVDFIQHVQTETVEAALEGTGYADLPVLSLAAPFSRTALFPAGEVTIRDIAGLYIYDNTLHAVTMTGAQVKDYLEYGNGMYFHTVAAGDTFDPTTDTNLNGRPDYHLDLMSGVNYEVDLSEPVGSKIENLTLTDGTPVTDDMEFVVAVNNYRRSGGGAYPHITTAPLVYDEQQEDPPAAHRLGRRQWRDRPADFLVENWWRHLCRVIHSDSQPLAGALRPSLSCWDELLGS